MSYDVWLEMNGGGSEPIVLGESLNMTGNVAPMWRLAGADLAAFDHKAAGECLPILRAAVVKMEDDPQPFKALDPPNGWGDYDSCLEYLRDLVCLFVTAPAATVRVSR